MSDVDWAIELRSILKNGLYLRNAQDTIKITGRALRRGTHILPAYTIQAVASDIFSHWDERAVTSTETHKAESILLPAFDSLLNAVINNEPPDTLVTLTESLIKAALTFFYPEAARKTED